MRHPPVELRMNVVNQSERLGSDIRLIVLHDTESGDYPGTRDLAGIGSWFNTPAAQASAHVCVDAEGNSARYVPDARKAWHGGNVNSYSLGIEQCGRASFTQLVWRKRRKQLTKVAHWVAYWSDKHGIPIHHSTSRGVCQHKHISGQGGHSDCGFGYPERYVLWKARRIKRAHAK